MKIAVLGAGCAGLTTAACLADLGHKVVCTDIVEQKIAQLQKGVCTIFEADLPELIKKNLNSSQLSFSASPSAAKDADVIFLCVGTPPKPDGSADLSFMEKALIDIGPHMKKGVVIVEKSTVPVQTIQWVKSLLKRHAKVGFDVAVNPEFLREGSAVHDFFYPDRIVIGTESEKARRIMNELYVKIKVPIVNTDLESAELIKTASNSFLTMKISFANLVSQLCAKTNADVKAVMDGVGMDKRIGRHALNAGLGFGGMCFPKDLDAFIAVMRKNRVDPALFEAVKAINVKQRALVRELSKELLGSIKGKTIGVLGLSFKPNTDDIRLSPAMLLIEEFQKEGAKIRAYDPQGMENAKKMLKGIVYAKDAYDAAKGSDLIILATEWEEFKKMDLKKIKSHVSRFIDARNVFEPGAMKKLGFEYRSIGRH